MQEGTLGLLRAIERFDFASGGNFTAYASATIRYAILNALPMEDTIKLSHDLSWRNRTDERIEALRALQPLSLDAAYAEDGDTLTDITPAPPLVLADPSTAEEERQRAKRAQVEALLARLTPREQQVLRLRYGLNEADGRAHTPTAIARLLGIECSTVCNLERRALQKLRYQKHQEGEEDQHPQGCRPRAPLHDAQAEAQRRQEQHQRLESACPVLAAQGTPISVRALARLTHVDKAVIGPFLHQYWEQQGTEQGRLVAACAALEAEDLPVTLAGLCSRAHVGSQAAAAFLREYHPSKPKRPAVKQAPRATKASPQERLSTAFAQLAAQGEPITRTRLRQLAGVSTDTAGAFLREQRAGSATAGEQGAEE